MCMCVCVFVILRDFAGLFIATSPRARSPRVRIRYMYITTRTAMRLAVGIWQFKRAKTERIFGIQRVIQRPPHTSLPSPAYALFAYPVFVVGRNFSPRGHNRRDECPRSVFMYSLACRKTRSGKVKYTKKRNIKIYTFFLPRFLRLAVTFARIEGGY